ncbi:MAG: hypothetical protein ACI9UV_000284 [Algoriphagus sp.]|jgi:hypothetical protein
MIWVDLISIEAQDRLMSNLQKAVAEKGVDGAVEYCNVNAMLDEVVLISMGSAFVGCPIAIEIQPTSQIKMKFHF